MQLLTLFCTLRANILRANATPEKQDPLASGDTRMETLIHATACLDADLRGLLANLSHDRG